MPNPRPSLIETDEFPFEFLSRLAERESWRKELHRPIYHVHKWWAKRLGSIFRGILLGSLLPEGSDLSVEFYRNYLPRPLVVFDPFMGSGTTIGEAHKLGLTALGRDINPVAVEAARTAFGPLERTRLKEVFAELAETAGRRIRDLYASIDSGGSRGEVLYYFWVMQARCSECGKSIDLFSSYVIARNAAPDRRPEVQIVCPRCGDIFPGLRGEQTGVCPRCDHSFDPTQGPAMGAKANCSHCSSTFTIVKAIGQQRRRPDYRLYAKLVLTPGGAKRYLPTTDEDENAYQSCSGQLREALDRGDIRLPDLALEHGHNTRQAMNYGFANWRDFFNDRQLLSLGWLQRCISEIHDEASRLAFFTLFSGALEFNNLFASYKGEGTGAMRHMFSHHILRPERTPIEANPWGTPKSSGAFSNLFRTRLLRAVEYRESPIEISGAAGPGRVCSSAFSGVVREQWPPRRPSDSREIHLSCGDSSDSNLPSKSVDLVVTDPPFFDNVHYSELADFFFAWQKLHAANGNAGLSTTRQNGEVQDGDGARFALKLKAVFSECHRVLIDDGLLVFSYHHSRDAGWASLAEAILGAGFAVANSHPVKAEMSVATPKSQAKEPIQLDIILVCRKQDPNREPETTPVDAAIARAREKIRRLDESGFSLSINDRKVVLFGQLLTTLSDPAEIQPLGEIVTAELKQPFARSRLGGVAQSRQRLMFEEREDA